MTDRFARLARRKQALADRCARDREELAARWSRIRLPLNFGSLVFALGKVLRAHPLITAAFSSLFVSGYAGKLKKSAEGLLKIGQALRPLWSWWARHRRNNKVASNRSS